MDDVETLYPKLKKQAEDNGYYLNPDLEFTKDLIRGLITNKNRYGYMSCPCRLASGDKKKDLDIICPCDYRDDDVNEYGCCYCSLYVSKDVILGKKQTKSIPERRKMGDIMTNKSIDNIKPVNNVKPTNNSIHSPPVWRCKVCGYLCSRNSPPDECPICHAEKDRFEVFKF